MYGKNSITIFKNTAKGIRGWSTFSIIKPSFDIVSLRGFTDIYVFLPVFASCKPKGVQKHKLKQFCFISL